MNRSWDETSTLLGLVFVVGIFLIFVLICLLLCYRRRNSSVFQPKVPQEKPNEILQEDVDRVIKFGPTPSWTIEKRIRKKNQHVYRALERINEVDEERDNTSLRSRDSAALSVASSLRHPSSHVYPMNSALHDRPMNSARLQMGVSAAIYGDESAVISRKSSSEIASSSAGGSQRRLIEPLLKQVAHSPSTNNYKDELLNGGSFPLYASSTTYNRNRMPLSASMTSTHETVSLRNDLMSGRITNEQLKILSFQSILRQVDSNRLNLPENDREFGEELKTFAGEPLSYFRKSDASGLPNPPPDRRRPRSHSDYEIGGSLFYPQSFQI